MRCAGCEAPNDDTALSCFSCGAPLRRVLGPGSLIGGRYEILQLLGEGGMGTVYRAHDRVLDEVVAIKTLRGDVARDPEVSRRFLSEIKLARRVRHENVCGIHEYGEDGPLRFIAMEYVDGEDLRRQLRRGGPLPRREAFEVSLQLAHGLEAIHAAGVIHRDLKTSNIMRDSHGTVRLMDFGIAKQLGADVTLSPQLIGTPEYMSPEQARAGAVDFRSDVYALAIVIFEIFTGRVPFKGGSLADTILKQLDEPPPLDAPVASAIPVPLKAVLARALQKQPEERFQSAAEMRVALQLAWDVAEVEPVGTGPLQDPGEATPTVVWSEAPTVERPGRAAGAATVLGAGPTRLEPLRRPVAPARRRRGHRPWPIVGVLAIAAGATVATALLRGRQPPAPARPSTLAPTLPPASASSPETQVTVEPAPRLPSPDSRASVRRNVDARPTARPIPLATPDVTTTPVAPRLQPPGEPGPPAVPASPAAAAATAAPPAPPSAARAATDPETPIPLPPSAVQPVWARSNTRPVYPASAAGSGVDAVVTLKLVVSRTGEVASVEVLAGDEPFVTAAVTTARDWHYSPALVDGQPRSVYLTVRIPFRATRPDRHR